MSDIDFDELDRAVNGVLGTSNTPTPAEPVTNPVETPSLNTVERTSLNPTTPSVATAAPAARRTSSGRFMDIVHPSSDMRTHSTDAPVAPIQSQPVTAQPLEQPAPAQEPAWNEPLDSPFLPDAKVEKRPLGGVAGSAPANDFDFQGLLDEPKEELLEAPAPQERIESAFPDPIDFAAANAVEDTEVISIEAEPASGEVPVQPEVASPEIQPAQPIEAAVPPVVEEPIGPTSITQQYKEQPSTTQQESGAIFDTESYHQPLAVPPKKKPGWLVFVWIGLLVVLGAGAGWAVYTFVLPML